MKKIIVEGQIVDSSDASILAWFGIRCFSPQALRNALIEAKGEDVELQINSPGGNAWAASSMYAELKEYKGNVNASIVGLAASAATILMCGCDHVRAWPTAQIMIHNPWTYAEGDQHDMESAKQRVETCAAGMIAAYTAKTGRTVEELQSWMDSETWMSAQDALELGFVDEVVAVDGIEPIAAAASQLDIEKMRELYLQAHADNVADDDWQNRASARLQIEQLRY